MATSTSVHNVTRIVVRNQISTCEGMKQPYQVLTLVFFKDKEEAYEITLFAPDGVKAITFEHVGA